jgi:hypothetical protein
MLRLVGLASGDLPLRTRPETATARADSPRRGEKFLKTCYSGREADSHTFTLVPPVAYVHADHLPGTRPGPVRSHRRTRAPRACDRAELEEGRTSQVSQRDVR